MEVRLWYFVGMGTRDWTIRSSRNTFGNCSQPKSDDIVLYADYVSAINIDVSYYVRPVLIKTRCFGSGSVGFREQWQDETKGRNSLPIDIPVDDEGKIVCGCIGV